MARIIIDAGHGGREQAGSSSAYGARGAFGILEKDVTLDIAKQVVARLGSGAALTRTGDDNLPLGARAARGRNADLFVSIHANYGAPELWGPEVYVHPEAGRGSRALAGQLARALDRLAGRYGGGSEERRAAMAVLNPTAIGAHTAACLVEVDYLSNTLGERRLGDPRERAAIGAAIASGIQEHISTGLDRAPEPDPFIIPNASDYVGTGILNYIVVWGSWFLRYSAWRAGVPTAAYSTFPHNAIAELDISYGSRAQGWGTGFYIGPNKMLTVGHNLKHPLYGLATAMRVRLGKRPGIMWTTGGTTIPIADAASRCHPRWASGFDLPFDLAVVRTPGVSPAQFFPLPDVCPADNQNIVVCGYHKFVTDPLPMDQQGQFMDGGRITAASAEEYYFPMQSIPGASGAPVFWPARRGMVVAVLSGPRITPSGDVDPDENRGVLLTPAKIDWINRM